MRAGDVLRSVKAEINARRKRGGATDVPQWLWDQPAVTLALRGAVEQAQREDFDGDWHEASLPLEDRLDALAAALLDASHRMPSGGSFSERLEHRPATQRERPERQGWAQRPEVIGNDIGSVALTEYLDWTLRGHWMARSCHRVICGGQYLSREQAWAFLTSDLPSILYVQDCEYLGLHPVEIRGRVTSWPPDDFDWHETSPHGTIFYVAVKMPIAEGKPKRLRRMVLDRSLAEPLSLVSPWACKRAHHTTVVEGLREYTWSYSPLPVDRGLSIRAYDYSAVGQVMRLASRLCSSYPVSIVDMMEALLTGSLPPQPTLTAAGSDVIVGRRNQPEWPRSMGPVTLTVQPWVSPEALADAWRQYHKRSKGYAPSAMQADALRFVLSHTPPGEEFAWERLARQWQEERGERMTRGELHKRFGRARSAILPARSAEE